MIVHIALFSWKKTAKEKDIDRALKDVKMLKKKVEGMAKTKVALNAYRIHPFHKKIADRIEKMEEKSIGIDFED